MLDAGLADGRHHYPRAAGQAREHGARLVERIVEGAAVGREPRFDATTVLFRDVADLQKTVDEQAQPGVGGHAPGAGVRRAQESQLREILHGIADRSGREVHAASGDRPRAHRIAGLEIGLDDPTENIAGPGIQFGEAGAWRGDGAQQGVGHKDDDPCGFLG